MNLAESWDYRRDGGVVAGSSCDAWCHTTRVILGDSWEQQQYLLRLNSFKFPGQKILPQQSQGTYTSNWKMEQREKKCLLCCAPSSPLTPLQPSRHALWEQFHCVWGFLFFSLCFFCFVFGHLSFDDQTKITARCHLACPRPGLAETGGKTRTESMLLLGL